MVLALRAAALATLLSGTTLPAVQRRMAEVLESREAHYMVIGLVLLDLAIVLAELVLSSFYPTPELAPHLGGWPVAVGLWCGKCDALPSGWHEPSSHCQHHCAAALAAADCVCDVCALFMFCNCRSPFMQCMWRKRCAAELAGLEGRV